MNCTIRAYRPEDFENLTTLWRAARERAFPEFQRAKGYPFNEDQVYFRDVILVNNDIWVADVSSRQVGFLAIAGDLVEQLFVAPGSQRQGVGQALLAHAKTLSPEGLRLFTFQINANGRAFYEKNGFQVVRYGVSSPPECEPDVEYHWVPSGKITA